MNLSVRHCLVALALAGCASKPSPPVAQAKARPLDPFVGDVAARDVPTVQAFCELKLDDAKRELDALHALPAKIGVAESPQLLERYDETLAAIDTASSLASVLFNASPDAGMRAVAEHCVQAAASQTAALALDRALYDRLAQLDLGKLDAPTRYWISSDLAQMRRDGVDRDEATRAQLKVMRDELTALEQKFEGNINDGARSIEVTPAELDGMPADWIAGHKPGADGKITVTTQYPDSIPFMTFAKSSSARERLLRANSDRAYPQNIEVLKQLLVKRRALAQLLGYKDFASYAMADKMIGTPQAAHQFIDKIVAASGPRADRDYQQVLKRLQKDQPRATRVAQWDAPYLTQRLRAEQLDFDAQSVRPYFEFDRVQAGLLDVTSRLFGIRYQRIADAKTWHPDVEVYDVFEGDKRLGRIYLDLHPRDGKYSHAAQFTLVTGKEGVRLPEGVLLCNFPKAQNGQPALMDHGDVRAFFHEFGHLLHHVFAGHTRWFGTDAVRESDFIEAPSQLLEEWIENPAVLQTFARHITTNQPIPTELVKRMIAAEQFGRGLDVRRQMLYASVSLAYHELDPATLDTTKTWAEIQDRLTPYAFVEGTHAEAAFGHLVGYTSNYYTYMWSLVIAKDLFTAFQKAGIMDRATAKRYRQDVLAAGGSKPAAEMVRDFLGRPFSFDAYAAWLNKTSS